MAVIILAWDHVGMTFIQHFYFIDSFNHPIIDSLVSRCGALVTAEDHNVIGGLGSAVAEHLVANAFAPLEMVGVPDRFGESGQADEMLEVMKISSPYIADAARKAISLK